MTALPDEFAEHGRQAAGSIEAWRLERLYEMGVPYERAYDIAHKRSREYGGFAVDVHYVKSLMASGATLEQALNLADEV